MSCTVSVLWDNLTSKSQLQPVGSPCHMMRGSVITDIFADMWAAVIEKYPDRFLIASDKVGHWTDYPHENEKYYLLLDKLKPETAEKLCKKNALSLIKKWKD